jgi:conjugative transfer signal peptidase TraF
MTDRFATLAFMAMAIMITATSIGAGSVPRFVWNISASAPTGLYRVRPAPELTVAMLVVAYPSGPLAACLADGRYLPHGVPLLKPVLAVGGQTVCRAGTVITIDGRDVGAAQERDHSGRPLPVWQGRRAITEGEVFLMNPNEPASLDGRYFGPISVSAIAGRVEPLWTPQRTEDLASVRRRAEGLLGVRRTPAAGPSERRRRR